MAGIPLIPIATEYNGGDGGGLISQEPSLKELFSSLLFLSHKSYSHEKEFKLDNVNQGHCASCRTQGLGRINRSAPNARSVSVK